MQSVVPTHLAIICDGNRRWARAHSLEVFKGHERAVNEVFEPLIYHAIKRGIKYLTFWIFSTENWDRDPKEVAVLMTLFRSFFDKQVGKLHKNGVRVNMIGDLSRFDQDIQEKIKWGMNETKNNDKITVTLAMNYGGRDEIMRAINNIKKLPISREEFETLLDTKSRADLPDPDFIVRTSGEQRLSGFMPWQATYAELWFPKFHFPEFTPEKLDEAIAEFGRRSRRFGK